MISLYTRLERAYNDFINAQVLENAESHSRVNNTELKNCSSRIEFKREVTVNRDFAQIYYQLKTDKYLRDNSSIQQRVLLRLICNLLLDSELDLLFKSGKGQVGYLLANAVASYGNYHSFYWISEEALNLLIDLDFDLKNPISRNKIFQIRDIENSNKKKLTFEHMCPATQLIDYLKAGIENLKENHNKWSHLNFQDAAIHLVQSILNEYSVVTIITKEEDKRLFNIMKSNLDNSINSSLERILHRYEQGKISIAPCLIEVYGKMYR